MTDPIFTKHYVFKQSRVEESYVDSDQSLYKQVKVGKIKTNGEFASQEFHKRTDFAHISYKFNVRLTYNGIDASPFQSNGFYLVKT